MQIVLRTVVLLVGVAIIGSTVLSAIRNFVVPRGDVVRIARLTFRFIRACFKLIRKARARTYEENDRYMAEYAPFSLFALPVVWLIFLIAGYTCVLWSIEQDGFEHALKMSGSSLFTLGFAEPHDTFGAVVGFSEAALGLALLALLISYLPTIYSAFSRREANVAMLEVRAGSPPSPAQFLTRITLINGLASLPEFWARWENWFVELEETHSSLSALVFFRSPDPYRSWVTASGVVLDSAAITLAAVETPQSASAALCIRSGFVALRKLASIHELPFDPDPKQSDETMIERVEFEELLDILEFAGVPIKADRDQAWLDFNGWRVNYDAALVGLAALVMAPPAPWSTDRIGKYEAAANPKLQKRLKRWK